MEDDFIADEIINSQKKNKKNKKKPPLECRICNEKFKFHPFLKDHFKNKHHGQYPYKCDHCSYQSEIVGNVKRHKKNKSCKVTKSLLSVPNQMHTKFKHDITNTADPSLNESLNQDIEDYFIANEIINSQKKNKKNKKKPPLECRICNEKFKFHPFLKDHFKNKHHGQYPYKCDHCFYGSMFLSNISIHKKRRHPLTTTIKEYICSFCHYPFFLKSELQIHEKIHFGIKDFKCTICRIYYTSNANLTHHNKRLHEEKPPPCFFCKQGFNNLYTLQQHYKNTHPLEPLVCEHCGKIFKVISQLKQHKDIYKIKKHIEQNPLQCFICLESFNNPDTLKEHSKDIHPKNNLICDYCGKLSTSRNRTQSHQKTCQSNENDKLEIGNNNHLDLKNIEEDSPYQEISHSSTSFEENFLEKAIHENTGKFLENNSLDIAYFNIKDFFHGLDKEERENSLEKST